jgi:hypothetical protein
LPQTAVLTTPATTPSYFSDSTTALQENIENLLFHFKSGLSFRFYNRLINKKSSEKDPDNQSIYY